MNYNLELNDDELATTCACVKIVLDSYETKIKETKHLKNRVMYDTSILMIRNIYNKLTKLSMGV